MLPSCLLLLTAFSSRDPQLQAMCLPATEVWEKQVCTWMLSDSGMNKPAGRGSRASRPGPGRTTGCAHPVPSG